MNSNNIGGGRNFFFPARKFFFSEFPFSIRRMRHTPDDYDESVRCRREFWKIIYVISGHGKKIINERSYPLEPGSLFVIHPDDATTFRIESEAIEIYNIVFMPELISAGLNELKNDFDFFSIFGRDFHSPDPSYRELLYVLDSRRETGNLINKLEKEYRLEAPNYRNMIKLYLQALLINISRLSAGKIARKRKDGAVQYIEHLINEHFREDLTLELLAEKVGMSGNHLCRIFKEHYHCTITERLLERRLTCAAAMLRNDALTVTEICFECGFNNLSYFYRAFNNKFGMPPRKFRKNLHCIDILP
jgi:AraC-like DNA-binding protein